MDTDEHRASLSEILLNAHKAGFDDERIADLLGTSRGNVNRWVNRHVYPQSQNLFRLINLLYDFGTEEQWSMLFEARGLEPPQEYFYREERTYSYPTTYVGPVWTKVVPRDGSRLTDYDFTIQWLNPTHPSGGVEFKSSFRLSSKSSKTLLYHKLTGIEGFPVRFTISPPCRVSFGRGEPRTAGALDLSKEVWSPIRSDSQGNATRVLTLPFPDEFLERFRFQLGDVLYIIIGDKHTTNVPLTIAMRNNVLMVDLTPMFKRGSAKVPASV